MRNLTGFIEVNLNDYKSACKNEIKYLEERISILREELLDLTEDSLFSKFFHFNERKKRSN